MEGKEVDVKEQGRQGKRAQLSAGSPIDAAIDDPAYSGIPAYIRDFDRPAPTLTRRVQPALPIDRPAEGQIRSLAGWRLKKATV
jgi:hypothetical protein